MPSKTSRFWCFTLHPRHNSDGTEQEIQNTLPEKAKYACYQKERGSDGKEHYQGYIEFSDAVAGGQRTSWVKDWIPGAHVEIKYAKRESARHYCLKPCSADCKEAHCEEARERRNGRIEWETTKPIELGDIQYGSGQGRRTDWDDVRDAIKNGASFEEIKDINYGLAMKHMRSLKEDIATHQPKRDWKTHVKVIYGDSGTGKSRYCRETYPDAYWLSKSSSGNVWWNGYAGQATVVIDDFYGWIPFDYMLHLMDRYPMSGETKGGVVNVAPRNIIITSNKEPQAWYRSVFKQDKQFQIAFSRRLESIEDWRYNRQRQLIKNDVTWKVDLDESADAENEDDDDVIPTPNKGGRLGMRKYLLGLNEDVTD